MRGGHRERRALRLVVSGKAQNDSGLSRMGLSRILLRSVRPVEAARQWLLSEALGLREGPGQDVAASRDGSRTIRKFETESTRTCF